MKASYLLVAYGALVCSSAFAADPLAIVVAVTALGLKLSGVFDLITSKIP